MRLATSFHKSTSRQIADVARLHRNRTASLLADIGLHPGQEKVLKALVERDGRAMGDLAAELGVQAPTVTKMISRLAAGGLVLRRQEPSDGRQARVFLTEAGRERAERIDRVWKALDRQTLAGLDAKDRKRLKKLLKRVRDNLGGDTLPLVAAPALASATEPAAAPLPEEIAAGPASPIGEDA